ncbi:MAG: hypothetical protein KIS86_16620 [Devosia sp.]|nr:hypothetical protein [Devosia sp.]
MSLKTLGTLAATLVLGAALTGCIDADVTVEITSATTAKATLTQIMSADIYAMVAMSADSGEESGDSFCAEGELTENADGSATCVVTEEGTFADLSMGKGEGAMVFTSAGPGLVRVALPTAEMKAEIGADDEMDEETRQMVEAFFTGHSITIRLSGAEVVDTNMTLAADRRSAETVLPFLDLINGTAELPEELFAVVRAP